MAENKIKVGQTVWMIPHRFRNSESNEPVETKVTKVGNKYFEIEADNRSRYYVETLRRDGRQYSTDGRVLLELQSWLDEIEGEKITDLIRKKIGQYGKHEIPLDTLRKIKELIH